MSKERIQKTARIYALQNAVQFNGKANPKAVVGKVIAVLQKEGFSPKELIPIINSVTSEINKLSLGIKTTKIAVTILSIAIFSVGFFFLIATLSLTFFSGEGLDSWAKILEILGFGSAIWWRSI